MRYQYRAPLMVLAALAALSWQLPALADPPGWAHAYGASEHEGDHDEGDHHDEDRYRHRDDRPHYGYRHDHDGHHHYRGYGGDDWDDDYGVVSGGHCNTDAVLAVAGAVTGGIIGNRTSAPENRGIATVIGAIAGGIIGDAVGDAIDDGDRACLGHSLELARVGQPVIWRNPHSHMAWRVVPVRDVSRDCREFDLHRSYYGRLSHERVIACRRDRGDWEFRGR